MIVGRIVKGVGGTYWVETSDGIYECTPKGVFRKDNITPLVGDEVNISLIADKGRIEQILPRKNSLVRPPVANIDLLFIVAAAAQPEPSTLLIDKLTAVAVHKNIKPIVCINKIDLSDGEELASIYRLAGFDVLCLSAKTGEGIEQILSAIKGRTAVFAGVSGVGKSSLLKRIAPQAHAEIQAVSRKTGRGRHTTRHVEIFKVGGGYIADTPGFSSLDIGRFEVILKDELASAFPDFAPFAEHCRFSGCAHIAEKGCKVIEALKRGEIAQSRYESYKAMYEEVKDIKEWELK